MALSQASLFDFEEPTLVKDSNTETLAIVENLPDAIVINEDPIEIEFKEEIKLENNFTDTLLEAKTIEVMERAEEAPQSLPYTERKNKRGRIKLSEMEATIGMVVVPDDDILFSKKYYSIGVVANMFGVNVSLIRFWEKEFDALKPKLNGKGDRLFRPEDVKILKQIHHLLREKKYTIEGAKEFLKKNKQSEESFLIVEEMQKLKLFLTDLKLSL